MSDWVLDASALLALVHGETGRERVREAMAAGAVISTVNLAEVVSKLADDGMPETAIRATLAQFSLDVAEFNLEAAFVAGLLRPRTRSAGLSLADRACIALGRQSGLPVLTTDRAWRRLDLSAEVEIEMLR